MHQTVLEGTPFLLSGKALVLGSVNVPGSTRHVDVEAMMEPIS